MAFPTFEIDETRSRTFVENESGIDFFPLAVPVCNDHIEDLDVVSFDFEEEGPEPAVIIADIDAPLLPFKWYRLVREEYAAVRQGNARAEGENDNGKDCGSFHRKASIEENMT
jgi:hypothetical protein